MPALGWTWGNTWPWLRPVVSLDLTAQRAGRRTAGAVRAVGLLVASQRGPGRQWRRCLTGQQDTGLGRLEVLGRQPLCGSERIGLMDTLGGVARLGGLGSAPVSVLARLWNPSSSGEHRPGPGAGVVGPSFLRRNYCQT